MAVRLNTLVLAVAGLVFVVLAVLAVATILGQILLGL
jgi:hypothetical protein